MKVTGVVRKLDNLGRIVIPREHRRTLQIEEQDPIEISVENDTIVLRKYQPTCILCGGDDDLISYKNRNICAHCAQELAKK